MPAGASSDEDTEEEDVFPDASGSLRRISSSYGGAGGISPSQAGSALTRADLFEDVGEAAASQAGLGQHATAGMSPARPMPRSFVHEAPLSPSSDMEDAPPHAPPAHVPGRFAIPDAQEYLASMPAMDGSLSIPITLSRGGRMFLRALEDPLTDAPPRPAGLPSEAVGGAPQSLLGTAGSAQSVKQMLADLEATQLAAAAQRPAGGGAVPPAPPAVLRSKSSHPVDASGKSTRGSMWVDKYAPKKFTDLLSPNDVNRNVLRWVKLWDFKVFGRPVKHSTATSAGAGVDAGKGAHGGQRTLDRALGGGHSKQGDSREGGGKRGDKGDNGGGKWGDKSSKFGKWGDKKHKFEGPPKPGDGSFMGFGYGWRADSKVILLAGPPGTGKTTLAHIIARTAGYEPTEINASDERTASKVRERLLNAQQMTSLASRGKPTLVVVDECDGMESAAVAEVVKMIKNTPSIVPNTNTAHATGKRGAKRSRDGDATNAEEDDEEGGEGGAKKASSKRKQKTIAKLTRPVICICNDVYAPALRELRQLAQVIDLKRPATEQLVERLSVICRKEDLLANRDALYELAAQSDNDVRSCLHTLQFLSQRLKSNASRISPDMVASAALGQKDSKSSLFDVWALTLTSAAAAKRLPRVARSMARAGVVDAATLAEFSRGGLSGGGGGSSGSKWAKAYARLLYSSYSALASEHRLLLAGLQENYPRTRCHDPSLLRGVAAADWLVYGDIVTQRGMSRSDFSLLRFLPVVAVGLHLSVASHSRVKTQFPRASGAARRAKEQRAGILATFCQGRAVGIRGLPGTGASDRRATVLDVVPSFLSIVNPPLRSVTASLLTPKEKTDAREAVAALLACRCTYAPARKGAPTAVPGGGDEADPFAGQQWQLTPEVHYLCSFGSHGPFHSKIRPALPDPMRRLLAHEVRLALLRAGHDATGHEAAAAEGTDTPLKSSDAKVMPEHVKKIIAAGRSAAASADGSSPGAVAAAAAGVGGGEGATPVKAALAAAAADGTSLLATQGSASKATTPAAAAAVDFSSPAATMVRIASWLQGGVLGDGPVGDGAAAAAGRRKQARRAPGERKRPRDKYPAYFQFQEGFTNAVRRPVYMEDVL